MADVDRGQLLLVGAFGLAVLFVVLALALNTAIYSENLATQRGDVPARDVAAYHHDVRDGTAAVLAAANRNNDTSYTDVEDAVRAGVADWHDLSARQSALGGRATGVEVTGVTLGTHVQQNESARNFTNRSGAADWTLASGLGGTRKFRMNVSTDSLPDGCSSPGDCFRVNVTDGTDTWRVAVYSQDDDDTTVVRVTRPDGTSATCTATGEHVLVDVTAGTVAGQDCPALRFGAGVSDPYEIRFANADEVTGTYSLVVDDDAVPTDPHYAASEGPTQSPAVYAVTVRLVADHPGLQYATEIRVAPGESDG